MSLRPPHPCQECLRLRKQRDEAWAALVAIEKAINRKTRRAGLLAAVSDMRAILNRLRKGGAEP